MAYIDFSNENIGIKGQFVIINRLESHREIGIIIGHLNRYFNNPRTKRLSLRIDEGSPLFPNLIVPLASVLHSLKSIGKKINLHTESYHIKSMGLLEPQSASSDNFEKSSNILDKIWVVKNEYHLKNAVHYLRHFLGSHLGFESALLDVLELALIEALENALVHSEAKCCFLMGQIHRAQNYFSLCVSDAGIGVKKSLADGGCEYESEPEALASSIKKGVTSKHLENLGGNGLYCLSRLAKINQGHFGMWSGNSAIVVDGKEDNDRLYENLPKVSFLQPATHIDFQIPLSGDISADYDEYEVSDEDLKYEPIPFEGFSVLKISEIEKGFCTRYAGSITREIATRFLNNPSVVGIVIDFDGIPICSASYIDSFIGILFKQIGQREFEERVRIVNATLQIRKTIYSMTKKR